MLHVNDASTRMLCVGVCFTSVIPARACFVTAALSLWLQTPRARTGSLCVSTIRHPASGICLLWSILPTSPSRMRPSPCAARLRPSLPPDKNLRARADLARPSLPPLPSPFPHKPFAPLRAQFMSSTARALSCTLLSCDPSARMSSSSCSRSTRRRPPS